MLNIAVLVSGGGTNLQALLDSEARGENPNGRITLVVASKPGVNLVIKHCKCRRCSRCSCSLKSHLLKNICYTVTDCRCRCK